MKAAKGLGLETTPGAASRAFAPARPGARKARGPDLGGDAGFERLSA